MRRVGWLVLALVVVLVGVWSGPVEAQEDTVIQFFIVPVMTVDLGEGRIARGPKYIRWRYNPGGLVTASRACKRYGRLDMMVCAVDAEQAVLDTLAGYADVYSWDTNLEVNLPQAERSALTTYLEAAFVPADWITPADTRRGALKTVTGMFLFMQSLTHITGNSPEDWGVTLNTQYRNLDQQYQDAIVASFTALGYDAGVIRDNWTLRVLLKNAADQWGDQDISFGFVVL